MKEITPPIVANASRCLHSWYLECHGNPARRVASRPRLAGSEDPDDVRRRRIVEWLPDLAEPVWDGLDSQEAHAQTLRFMKQGKSWIFKGVLAQKGMWGRLDLLRKIDGRSALGNFTYAPLLVRLGPQPLTARDLFELRTQAHLLATVLGKRPERAWAYLGPGEMAEIDLRASAPEFDLLLSDMERVRRGEFSTEGCRVRDCDSCAWRRHCFSLWADSGHVCLLPGVTPELVAPLRDAGFSTWMRIGETRPGDLVTKAGLSPSQALEIWLHARARRRRKPILRRRPTFPDDRPIHFVDAMFAGDSCVALGTARFFQGQSRVRQFLAREANDRNEADIWKAFLEHVARDREMVIYPWSEAGGRRLRQLWDRHGGPPSVGRLLRDAPVSLRRFVRDHYALPVAAYRLEEVASLFPRRASSPLQAEDALRDAYEHWQETQDSDTLEQLMNGLREKLKAMQAVYFSLKVSTVATVAQSA